MKLYLTKICLLMTAIIAFSCQENNVFDDLGDEGGNTLANVYMEPLAPKLQAATSTDMEVQFWSLDDDFIYTGLWNFVTISQSFKTTVSGIEFKVQTDEDFQDWTESIEYPFDFADWVPDQSAYIKNIAYDIDIAYDATTQNSSSISAANFITALPEDFESQMFAFYTTNLPRSVLNTLMIDNTIMTQSEFDAHYAESGFLTSDGKTAITAGLSQIGTQTLVGNNYEIKTEYQITLAFRVTNGSQNFNESRRSFIVF